MCERDEVFDVFGDDDLYSCPACGMWVDKCPTGGNCDSTDLMEDDEFDEFILDSLSKADKCSCGQPLIGGECIPCSMEKVNLPFE